MATHSSTLAWKIPWTERPGRLQSMESLRVRHDWVTPLSLFTFITGEGNGNPLQCSCLENPRDRGAWWAAIYGVTQNWHDWSDLAAAAAVTCLVPQLGWVDETAWVWLVFSSQQDSASNMGPSFPNSKSESYQVYYLLVPDWYRITLPHSLGQNKLHGNIY